MDVPSFLRGRGAGFCMTMAGAVVIFANAAWEYCGVVRLVFERYCIKCERIFQPRRVAMLKPGALLITESK